MTTVDTGMSFWLRYVQDRGGLVEQDGDSALVVLSPAACRRLELPEELVVTGDPDVAREDGAVLLAPGHPALERAVDDVLAEGDVGRVAIRVPATAPPETSALVERARDQFPVDHGRIDAAGPPTKGVRSVLRIGALVNYTMSTEEHYQERVECFLDAHSRLELPGPVGAKLVTLPSAKADGRVDLNQLTKAVSAAHGIIDATARQRQFALSGQVAKALQAEVDRAEAYYRDVLATLARRQENAPADRRELLDARAEATRAERSRRVAEIREKYAQTHEIRPYRLHVLEVPVWRLPVDVRRGDRRYPFTVDWLLPLSRFADIRCPHCDAPEPLVAAKTRLGCTSCLAKPPVQLVPAPAGEAPKPAEPASKPVAKTTTARPAARSKQPAAPALPLVPAPARLSPDKIAKAGDKLSGKLWDAVVNRDRRLSRLCAPDSPAAAALRLYGPDGAGIAIGLPPEATPLGSASDTTPADPEAQQATRGFVETTSGERFPFVLWWRMVDGTPLIDEILPFDAMRDPSRLPLWVLGPGRRIMAAPPQPRIPLGLVGGKLWERALPQQGLPVVLRCLAAWWRIPDEAALLAAHSPIALAAALDRMIRQRAGRPGGRYAEAALVYGVGEDEVRAAGTDLQRVLKLSKTTFW